MPPPLKVKAIQHAVARFWDLLQDLCAAGTLPAAWRSEVPASHPFVRWDAGTQRWRVHRLPPT